MLNLVLVPFLSFYILKDFELIKYRVKMLFPRKHRQRVSEIYAIVDQDTRKLFRGALTIAFINSIVITSLMSIWGVKYPLVIGLISGTLDMIPYFGIIISTSVAVLISLFGDNPGFQVVMVLISFLGMNLTETAILYPKIIGSKIGVHPVLLILALLIFGYFMGFLGLLIAVPTTAILIALRKYYEQKLRPCSLSSSLYIVSTPIGNYDDITLRALNVLKEVDFIICEEYKEGNRLLRYYGIDKPLEALNEHNEAKDAEATVERIRDGADAALISDAGTPVFADPGARLVHLALKRGVRVVPVPGASSLLAALVVSDFDINSFYYAGFLPRRRDERMKRAGRIGRFEESVRDHGDPL